MGYSISSGIINKAIFGSCSSSSGSSGAISEEITQAGHGFSLNQAVAHDGSEFVKADISSYDIVLGVVSSVGSVDQFTISKIGSIENAGITTLIATMDSDNLLYLGNNGLLVNKTHSSISGLDKIPILKKIEDGKAELVTSTQYLGFKNNIFISTLNYGEITEDGSWKVELDGEFLKYYRRESGAWVLKETIGRASPIIDESINFENNEMLKYDSSGNIIKGTGDTNTDSLVNFGDKDISCRKVITESDSIDIGAGITLSDTGGYLRTKSNMSGSTFLPVDSKLTTAGSEKPTWDKRSAMVIKEVIQSDKTQQMDNVVSYTISPSVDQDVYKVYLHFVTSLTNFRARIISGDTGSVTKHIPTRHDYDSGTGLTIASGEQSFEIPSAIGEVQGIDITVEMQADQSISLMGDGTNPWRAIDRQPIEDKIKIVDFTDMIDEDDMVSNSENKIPTQQSVKAYVDSKDTEIADNVDIYVSSSYIYTAVGVDGSWYVKRMSRTGTNSIDTHTGVVATKPTSLSEVEALTYS